MQKKSIISVAAVLLAAFLAFTPVNAKKNIFQRTKEFFTDDKKKNDKDTAAVSSVAIPTELETQPEPQPEATRVDYKDAEDLYDLPFSVNLNSPKLGNQKSKIREFQQRVAKKMISNGHNVETTRNGEVIVATIAASDLFLPNDTVLRPTASKYLSPYTNFLKEADFYHMLLLMHSDNTGSEDYTMRLTEARVLAVFNWLKSKAACSDYVIPYGMGSNDPLSNTPNNSVSNREKNRRLEIYLVPGKTMIKKSSRGQLK